jgi:hypothetical protein
MPLTWTRVTDADEAADLLPARIGRRLIGLHGRFGLLLTTGDVMRITSIQAVHHSSDGVLLLDVSLDNAGVPEGVDLAWRPKHFLGVPVSGATAATVNLAHVVAAVEFFATATIEPTTDDDAPTSAEVVIEMSRMANELDEANPVSSTGARASHVSGSMAQASDAAPPIEMIDLASSVVPVTKSKKEKKEKKRKK